MELWGGKLVVVENAGAPFYSNLVKARRKTGVDESNTLNYFNKSDILSNVLHVIKSN